MVRLVGVAEADLEEGGAVPVGGGEFFAELWWGER